MRNTITILRLINCIAKNKSCQKVLIINMKPFSILAISFFALHIATFAQQFQGGIAAGMVASQVAGDTYSGYHKLGAYVGMWVQLDLNERSSFQTELSYIQKGSRHNPDDNTQDYTSYLMRLGYIEMPVLYQYHLKNKITLEVGPAFSFLVHSYEEFNYDEIDYGEFNLFNLSFIAGIGYPITEKIGAYFRVNSSITSIRTNGNIGSVDRFFDSGQYNDALVLLLSYKL